jgi:predicted permease
MSRLAGHARDLVRDVRYAARTLSRAPGFTLAAVVCLGLGIGLAAAMYSQIQSVVFRAVPGVREPDTLVRLQRPMSFAFFEDLERGDSPLAPAAAYMGPVPVVVRRDGGEAQRVWGQIVTPDYFDVLGTPAALGRTFGPDEWTPGAARVVVLSDAFWRGRLGEDRTLVGRTITVNGERATVAGIAPPGFLGVSPMTSAADIWIPTTAPSALAPELARLTASLDPAFEIVGRLPAGLGMSPIEEALEGRVRELERVYNDPARQRQERRIRLLPAGRVLPIRDEDLPRAIGFPVVLVLLVLLMACGNVANMVFARSAARHREIAVRLSLGAGPGRVLRQLLAESLCLTVLGAGAGLAFAFWLLWYLQSVQPFIPAYSHLEVRFEWAAFAFAALLAGAFAVLFGLAPARRAGRTDIQAALKPNAPSWGAGRPARWLNTRNVLVFQQVTVSILLLLLTSFVVVGWQRAADVDLGFDPAHLYVMKLDPVRDGYAPADASVFFERLRARLAGVPGFTSVSLAQTLPPAMATGESMLNAKVEFVGGEAALGAVRADRVGAGFFETAGVAVRFGREFSARDETGDSPAVVVSAALADRMWPGENPVGRRVDIDGAMADVIGVVDDLRSAFPLAPTSPALYRPIAPSGFAAPSRHGVLVAVRAVPGLDASSLLRREVQAIDPSVTIFETARMTDDVGQARYLARFATVMYGGMGVFGLILASVGLAGVTAQAVARRRREIGIRMALGARRADVLWLVLRESGAIVIAGTAAGLVLAILVARALASVLEALAETTRTSLTDPLLLVGAPALLAALALLACYLPARQSTRIDPATALRSE